MKPQSKNLVEVMLNRADETPDRIAFHYIERGLHKTMSCAELKQQALSIALELQKTCSPGDRALLLYSPGTHFVSALFGCFAAGVIAVPAPPPHPKRLSRTLPRVQSIMVSAQPKVVLTESKLQRDMKLIRADYSELDDLKWLSTDTVNLVEIDHKELPRIEPDQPAFLQYTSGSTASPKGVILSHRSLLENIQWFNVGWDHTPDSLQVCWLPAYHDLGLVYGILAPLTLSFPVVLMSPVEIITSPFTWLKTIADMGATHSAGPNFIYDLCVLKVSEAQRQSLDLSKWKMALTAAEPVQVETLQRFYAAFKDSGFAWQTFCPGYGMSEATCKVTASRVGDEPSFITIDASSLDKHCVRPVDQDTPGSRRIAACGKPESPNSVRIVDPTTRQTCAANQVGEIWVSGSGVGSGYWERPEASKETFDAHLADSAQGPWLRTGDLGFVFEDQLYVTGRLKDLVIIRGENHYPQDIEFAVQDAHSAIRPGCIAAFAIEANGAEKLVVVAELERRFHERRIAKDTSPQKDNRRQALDRRQENILTPSKPQNQPALFHEIRANIRQAVATKCGIQVSQIVLIQAGNIPKTSSGKIQRRLCKKQVLNGILKDLESHKTRSANVA